MPKLKRPKLNGYLPKILLVAGIIILVIAVFVFKNQPSKPTAEIKESPQTQLDRHISEGKPTFAFFHSTNCQSCIVMMDTVAQVYPEFKNEVALVDVDVYDSQNESLLQRARINSIPTLVFIDNKGEGTVIVGVMEQEVLRMHLTNLRGTP